MTRQQRQRWVSGKRKFTPNLEQFKKWEARILAEMAAEASEQRRKYGRLWSQGRSQDDQR